MKKKIGKKSPKGAPNTKRNKGPAKPTKVKGIKKRGY